MSSAQRLQAQSAAPPTKRFDAADLAGATWRITSVAGKIAPADARLQFTARSVSGSAGCNRIFASITPAASGLRINSVQTTLMNCTGRMDGERAVLAALAKVRAATRTGDALTLLDDTGAPVLLLMR